MRRTDAFGSTATNRFTSGDPVGGIPATRVSADHMNVIQEEIASVIEYAGISLDQSTTYDGGNDVTQLRQAIQALISAQGGVPVGSIQAYAGESIPTGWLECDGTVLVISGSPDLYSAIGTAWGGDVLGDVFKIPDLRGRFLRGHDGGAGVDPDRLTRTASAAGGNTGDEVGTIQDDEFQTHTHTYTIALGDNNDDNAAPPAASDGSLQGVNYNGTTVSSGGTETRPKNAAVKFIIKAGTYVIAS
jgi:microcystin-dependent protein